MGSFPFKPVAIDQPKAIAKILKDVAGVMDGDCDPFVYAYLERLAKTGGESQK